MREETIYFQNNLGLKLCGILSHPDFKSKVPLIIACHGFFSGKNNKTNRLLLENLKPYNNIAFFRFDFMGHYDSQGSIEDITISQGVNDLVAAISVLEQKEYLDFNNLGLFGTSFGGNVVLWYASFHNKTKAIALKAPVSNYAAVREMQLGESGIHQWKTNGYQLIDGGGSKVKTKYDFYTDSKSVDTYSVVKNINANILIVHGTSDDNVPINQSIKLHNVLKNNSSLIKIEGANHGFKGEGQLETVIKESNLFFQKNLVSHD